MAAPGEAGRGPGKLFRFLFVETTFATVLGVLVVLGGLMAYDGMVKESSPDLAIPTALVTTNWPGAAPELMEKEVTRPLETAIKSLSNLKQVSSGSRSGVSTVLVEFQADAPVEESIRALRTKVTEAAGLMPSAATTPMVEHVQTTDVPVMTWMLFGDVPDAVIGQTARDLKERLERVGSLRKVEVSGAREAVGRILVDPLRLNAVGLTMNDVAQAIRGGSVDRPLGEVRDGPISATISLTGRFTELDALRALPVGQSTGGPVIRLGDIASVRHDLSTEHDRTFVSFGDAGFSRGVSLTLFKAPGSDTIAVAEEARRLIGAFPLPAGLSAQVMDDQSVEVSQKLTEVFTNAGQATIGVVLVLLVMLTWREAVIAGAAIPVTFLGAIAVAALMGFTMNTLVVIGMVLALGLLVDVFILVMEGMHQGLYVERRSFPDAVVQTVRRFGLPAFAGQLTTILALMPLLFLPGTSGQFIRLIPAMAIICLVLSYFIAFVWALPSSRYLLDRPGKVAKETAVDRISARLSDGLGRLLLRAVVPSRRIAALWIVASVAVVAATVMAAGALPFTMYPKEDGINMGVSVELPPGTPLDRSTEVGKRLGDILAGKDYTASVVLYVGRKSPYAVSGASERMADTPGSHVIGFSVGFTPLDARDGRMSYTYVPELRADLAHALRGVPGATLVMAPQVGGPSGGDDIQIELRGDDLGTLRAAAAQVRALVAAVPGTADVRDSTGAASMAVTVAPKREAFEFFGVPLGPLADDLALALGETQVARLKRPGMEDDVPVMLSLAWPSRNGEPGPPTDWRELSLLLATGGDGSRVALPTLFETTADALPQVIIHSGGERSITVRGKAEGVQLGQVLAQVLPQLPAIQAAHPGIEIGLAGEAQEASETSGDMMKLFVLTLVLMFALLVLLFNSYRLPFIILFTVPCGLVGTLTGFLIIGMPLSFPALVGIVSLIGIVVNVSIVMIETMREAQADGMPLRHAAARGAADRLRPIVSTTLTTVAGLVLLSFASPMWQPLCYAIIFGLMSATVLAFIVIPALYLLMSRPSLPQPDAIGQSAPAE